MTKRMGRVAMTLPMYNMARAMSECHRCLFWALGKPQKAEIWHVGGFGHDKANGQGGDDPPHVERGQGHVRVPQVPLLPHFRPIFPHFWPISPQLPAYFSPTSGLFLPHPLC